MRKALVSIFVVLIAFYGAYEMLKRKDPAKGDPRLIEVGILQTMKQFIDENNLMLGPRVPQGYVIDADKLKDVWPVFFDDNWIRLRILDGAQSFELPPGRTLQIVQNAGRIYDIYFRPFAQPKPLGEMHDYLVGLVKELEDKGWRNNSSWPIKIPSSLEDFDSNGKIIFADMISPSGNTLQLDLRDYGLAPKQDFFILQFNPFHKPAERSRTYLLGVSVSNYDVDPDYGDLVYPRRLFLYGDKNKEIPLRVWIEDPDWTPQEAGMIPVPPERTLQIRSDLLENAARKAIARQSRPAIAGRRAAHSRA